MPVPGAVPVPRAGPGAGRGGARRAARPVPWEPGGPVDAHGFQPGAAGGGRFLRRFPLAEPGAGAARAAAALGPAQALEVAQHLDIAGAQRAQRRRGAGRVSGTAGTRRDTGMSGGTGTLRGNGDVERPRWESAGKGALKEMEVLGILGV